MNTFTIYKNNSIVFNRVCSSPPSVEDISIILFNIESFGFSSLGYRIDLIHGDKHEKTTGRFYNVHKFFDYLTNLCEEWDKFGVVMYLN